MKQTFLTKVSYTKQFDNGTFKRVVEQYLFDGHTFTDCEANVYTHLGERIRGEFTIIKMDRFHVDNVVYEGTEVFDKFFLVKMDSVNYDDVSVKYKFLINAADINQARTIAIEFLVALAIDVDVVEIKSIVETKILDYFQSAETIEE